MVPSESSADNLADLRPNYIARLHKRTLALNAFLEAVDRDQADAQAFESSHRCVHSMISSAAIFGYADLSAAARTAEAAFEEDRDDRALRIRTHVEDVLRIANDVVRAAANDS